MPKKIPFYKYQGTGNDFILIDNRELNLKLAKKHIQQLCARKFGIGSDGLMLIDTTSENGLSFDLKFFNPDGSVSFCGNGSRCAVAFAKHLGIAESNFVFRASDGVHAATIADKLVSIQLGEVGAIANYKNGFFLNTGSPHVVLEVANLKDFPLFEEGKKIRYDPNLAPSGTNVNFTERISENTFAVRTYERGVEDETLSCGTGVTAVAIAMHRKYQLSNTITIETRGGKLNVNLEAYSYGYKNIWLKGPAEQVFKGEILLH